MGIEIERKFLVNKDLWNENLSYKKEFVIQAYLVHTPDKTIRVRVKNEEGYVAIKGQTNGYSRLEYEYAIPLVEARELIEHFTTHCVEKIRHYVIIEDKVWEVDVFTGENDGLIIAEIELSSEEESFSKPNWIAEEVSNKACYFNSYLAEYPYCK